jgi:hypothetical protein
MPKGFEKKWRTLRSADLLSNGGTAIIGMKAIANGEGISTAATSARWPDNCSTMSQLTGRHGSGCLLKSK